MKAFVRGNGQFFLGGLQMRCALGKGGLIEADRKREGDGATPIGVWPVRRVMYRADRTPAPDTTLPLRPIQPDDGWCDDPADSAYNRPVSLPYPARCERMWRDDHVYDLVVVLGYNDEPVVSGAGSAIFWHLARPDYRPTEGCVALSEPDMRAALALLGPGDAIEVSRSE